MRRASSGSTTAFRNSTPSLRPPSGAVAGSQRELPSGALVQDQEQAQRRESSESGASRPGRCSAQSHRGPGSDETVIGRLEYLAPQAGTPGGSMAATSLRAGNRREWPGSTAAGWARWPTARVGCSWPTSARWAGRWWTSGCISQELDLRQPVCCGGCAGGPAELPVKDGVGPGDAGAGPGVGLPQGRGRRRLRDVADLPGGTGGPGDPPCWTSSGRHYVSGPWTRLGPVPEYPGFGRPRNPSAAWAAADHGAAPVMNCRRGLAGDNGLMRIYRFSAHRVRATRRRQPGEELWAVWRRNLDRQRAPLLPAQPWRLWPTWVGPGGALKRSSRLRRVTWGCEYRPAAGQGGITT